MQELQAKIMVSPHDGVRVEIDLSPLQQFEPIDPTEPPKLTGRNRDIAVEVGKRLLFALMVGRDEVCLYLPPEVYAYITSSILGPSVVPAYDHVRPFLIDALSLASSRFQYQLGRDQAKVLDTEAPQEGWKVYQVVWDRDRHPSVCYNQALA